uniref:Uncharacterized protein n=1 Tax=Macaca fascicularis TaxID=9541 RepID=A0A7N9DHZ1_MACFA
LTWRMDWGVLSPMNFINCLSFCLVLKQGSRVHVHNVQVCYICIHVPCWCGAPINSSYPIKSSFTSL